jgi:L-threonylcarbamoyladenylate synthase
VIIIDSLTDAEVINLLIKGGIGIMPTDTVYGIVAQAANKDAVNNLYKAKNREGKPGTVIAANPKQLIELGIDERYISQVLNLGLWPNPVSVVLPAPQSLYYLHQGMDSLAVRVGSNNQQRILLESTGPLLTSSANLPGEPVANNVDEAQNYFGDSVDFYVKGSSQSKSPSTIVRLREDGSLEILRQGGTKV